MENDNTVNEAQERIRLGSRTPLFSSSVDRDGSEGEHSHASTSKHRYHTNVRKSIKIASTSESFNAPGNYNLRGMNKVTIGSSETSSVDSRQKRTRRVEQRTKRRIVMNGATVSLTDEEEEGDEDEEEVSSKHQMRKSLPHKYRTSDYSSDEGMSQDALKGTAFPIYKRAGEWWNVFPKTDYTYSPISPNRKEIVPGIIPMPNMSRRSIHATGNYQSTSSSRSRVTETHSRWFGATSSGTNLASVDSDTDEVDYLNVANSTTEDHFLITRVFISIFTSIWTFISYLWSSVVSTFRRIFHRNDPMTTPPRLSHMRNKSWLEKIFSLHYWMICYSIFLNIWVASHFTRKDTHIVKRREQNQFKYWPLLLIIPLIFAGWWCWWWLSSAHHESAVNAILTAGGDVVSTSSTLKQLLWWLPITSLWETENSTKMVSISDTSLKLEHKVNIELLAQKILANEQFQNLILSHELQRKQEREQAEQELLLQKERFQQELDLKDELLSKEQEFHAQLAGEIKHLREQIEHLGVELQNRDHTIVDNSHLQWRKEVRRLENQIRLLQESQSNRPCCKVPPPVLPEVAIEEHVMKFLSGLFTSDGEAEKKIPGIQTWISRLFVAKDDLEAKLANITSSMKRSIGEANRRTAQTIMATVSDHIKQEYLKQQTDSNARVLEERKNWVYSVPSVSENCTLTASQVQEIVNNALHVYDADKTGMVDYALESSGGSVINTRCTETYNARTATLSLLGFSLWWPSNNPRIVIQPGAHPGECWAFRGAQGYLVIRLSGRVKISAFSLEHIPVSLAPNGKIDSAPKDFKVWGLEHENDKFPVLLGKYVYEHNGTSLQIFNVQRSDLQPYEIVELAIDSNHGNMEYTCLYRFRVHGVLSP